MYHLGSFQAWGGDRREESQARLCQVENSQCIAQVQEGPVLGQRRLCASQMREAKLGQQPPSGGALGWSRGRMRSLREQKVSEQQAPLPSPLCPPTYPLPTRLEGFPNPLESVQKPFLVMFTRN